VRAGAPSSSAARRATHHMPQELRSSGFPWNLPKSPRDRGDEFSPVSGHDNVSDIRRLVVRVGPRCSAGPMFDSTPLAFAHSGPRD